VDAGTSPKLTEAVLNRELPRLPLSVSRRLTRVTRTTMRNKRRQRQLHVCRDRGRPDPRWAADREELVDVLCLAFGVKLRLLRRKELRALVGADP
jgi:hypothetical protein